MDAGIAGKWGTFIRILINFVDFFLVNYFSDFQIIFKKANHLNLHFVPVVHHRKHFQAVEKMMSNRHSSRGDEPLVAFARVLALTV